MHHSPEWAGCAYHAANTQPAGGLLRTFGAAQSSTLEILTRLGDSNPLGFYPRPCRTLDGLMGTGSGDRLGVA